MAIFWEQYYQAGKKSGKIAIVRLVQNYLAFGVSVGLVLYLSDEKYLGPILGQMIVGLATVLYFGRDLKPLFHWGFCWADVKYLFCYSIPLLPYAFSGEILGHFARLAINSYHGAADAGLFSLGYSIGAMLNLVWVSLQSTWMPTYFAKMNTMDYSGRDSELRRILIFFGFIAAGAVLFGKEAGMILAATAFHGALDIVPVIVLGQLCNALFNVYALAIHYSKKTQYLSLIVVGVGCLNVFLNLLWIPRYGFMAGAVAMFFSYFLLLVLGWLVAGTMLRINVTPLRVVLTPVLEMLPLLVVVMWLPTLNLTWGFQLGFKAVLLLAIGLIFWRRWQFRT